MKIKTLIPETPKSAKEFVHNFQGTLKSYFSDIHRFWVTSFEFKIENTNEITASIYGVEAFAMCMKQKQKIDEIFARESLAYFGSIKKLNIIESLDTPNVCIPFVRQAQSISSEIEPKYNFESFITSHENNVAKCIAQNFVENILSGNAEQNKLFICGTIGNGKTHLMKSIANCLLPSKTVVYLGAEKFMFLYTTAIRENTILEFRKNFYNTEVLLIDDVHFIASKKGTTEELLASIRAVQSSGGFVCMTGASNTLKENCGMIATIEDPSLSLRYLILKTKADRLGYKISDKILKTLAERINSNIRDIEGALAQIIMHSSILGSDINEDSTQFILKEIFTQSKFKKISIKTVIENTCNFYGITKEEMFAKDRTPRAVKARKAGIFLSRQLTDETITKIALEFGGRTRDAIMKTIKSMKDVSESDEISLLKTQILSS